MSLSIPSTSQLTLPDLPFDIITEILSHLPVKSLIRFKCVSKSFLYLISNSRFIRSHLNKSSNIINHQRFILKHVCAQSGRYACCLKSSSFDSILHSSSEKDTININSTQDVELDYPLKDQSYLVSIVGSCNGLVCILINSKWISIWNPSTRESNELPPLDNLWIDWNNMYGFGYDHLNDDYNVVWTLPHVDNGGWNETMVIVYSLKTKSWGNTGDFPSAAPYNKAAIVVSGVLHWKIKVDSSLVSSIIILSFDLINETYGEIAQPNYELSDLNWSLSVLEGCLCMCCEIEAIQSDIWVMKDYGVRDSWIKLCVISYRTFPNNNIRCCYSPVFMSMTGEILLGFADNLLLSNINSGKFRNYEFCNLCSLLEGFEAITYVESLVSPDNYDEVHISQY